MIDSQSEHAGTRGVHVAVDVGVLTRRIDPANTLTLTKGTESC